MKTRILWLLLIIGMLAAGAIIGLALRQEQSPTIPTREIKKFSSTDDLKIFLKTHQAETVPPYGQGIPSVVAMQEGGAARIAGGGEIHGLQSCTPLQPNIP